MSDRAPRIHLSLRVQPDKLAELVPFYAKVFGVAPRKHYPDYAQFDLLDPPLNLTFTPTTQAAQGEIDHLGIQVFSGAALEAARQRLTDAGLALREERDVDCCYARQSKFWVIDPEGREVEVFHKLADIEPGARRLDGGATAPSACCAPGGCASA